MPLHCPGVEDAAVGVDIVGDDIDGDIDGDDIDGDDAGVEEDVPTDVLDCAPDGGVLPPHPLSSSATAVMAAPPAI